MGWSSGRRGLVAVFVGLRWSWLSKKERREDRRRERDRRGQVSLWLSKREGAGEVFFPPLVFLKKFP